MSTCTGNIKKNEKVRAMGFQHIVEGINCLLREMESMPPASTVKDFENKISKTCLPTLAEMLFIFFAFFDVSDRQP